MRTIKFRTWDEHLGIRFPTSDAWFNLKNGEIELPKDTVLMQYTGINDKLGIGIYEGDIIEFYYLGRHKSEVFYMGDGFYVKTNGHKDEVRENLGLAFPFTEIKIIGNIYQNPELIN